MNSPAKPAPEVTPSREDVEAARQFLHEVFSDRDDDMPEPEPHPSDVKRLASFRAAARSEGEAAGGDDAYIKGHEAGMRAGRAEERERVVLWLRSVKSHNPGAVGRYREAAEQIERGDHLAGEK